MRSLRFKVAFAALAVLSAVLLFPTHSQAYVGPGAGFAVLSSFWTLFLAFLYSFYALVTWPLRQLYRFLRHSKAYGKARFNRVVILGFDGMDPKVAQKFIAAGKLPNLAKLQASGTFKNLRTTHPPISPVAWSTFMTGVNPGKHNIYDFLARDLGNYLPFLSSAQIAGPKRRIKVGKYSIPFGKSQIKGLRKSKPFWHWLGDAGVFCSVIRVPVTFPPEKFPGVLLSGMCVPDLKGSQGTFCFCTTKLNGSAVPTGGVFIPFERNGGSSVRSYIPGPDDPLTEASGHEMRLPFEVKVNGNSAQIEVDSQKLNLKVGEYSDWIPVRFKAGLGITAHGICRFYVKQVSPEVEIYVTPVNIDPKHPDLPISHPATYAIYLAKLLGPYATLGLAEDTWALNEHVLDDEAFLAQCYANHEDREKMLFDALEKTNKGVCTCVFDTTDRVQHMFWRYMEDGHPALQQAPREQKLGNVIEGLYQRMDALIGRVMAQLDKDSLLMVVSDHGFQNFARGINLNSWLHQNGYLTLKPGKSESADWFHDVDWSKTRAYTMGLNGLYLNIRGRERQGVVAAGKEAEALKQELRQKLNGLTDPQSGQVGITGVFAADAVYAGPYSVNAPDLIIGYGENYRASWDGVTGKVTDRIFEDNEKAWSGDHCVDARLVPGVLFCNRKIESEQPAIVDVAPTMLKLFGLPAPAHFDGKAWTIA